MIEYACPYCGRAFVTDEMDETTCPRCGHQDSVDRFVVRLPATRSAYAETGIPMAIIRDFDNKRVDLSDEISKQWFGIVLR